MRSDGLQCIFHFVKNMYLILYQEEQEIKMKLIEVTEFKWGGQMFLPFCRRHGNIFFPERPIHRNAGILLKFGDTIAVRVRPMTHILSFQYVTKVNVILDELHEKENSYSKLLAQKYQNPVFLFTFEIVSSKRNQVYFFSTRRLRRRQCCCSIIPRPPPF